MRTVVSNPAFKRLMWSLFGGFVLCLMIGNQEGSESDFGIAFFEATRTARLLAYLGVGLLIFVLVSFWPTVARYIRRPGALPVGLGFLMVIASLALMHWYDPVGKFGPLADEVSRSSGVPPLANLWFSWFAWAMLAGCLVLGGAAVVTRNAILGYAQVVLSLAGAVICYLGHIQLIDFAHGIDHSTGAYVGAVGFIMYGIGGLMAARATREVADPRGALDRFMGWRVGLPLIGGGLILGLAAFITDDWFAPLATGKGNASFHDLSGLFSGTGVGPLTTAYIGWMGPVLFAGCVVVGAVASFWRIRRLAWVTAALGIAGIVVTLITLYDITTTAAKVASQYGPRWQNLGAGGWVACIAFSLLAIGGFLAATTSGSAEELNFGSLADEADTTDVTPDIGNLPVHAAARKASASATMKLVIPVAMAVALFYPPTLTITWQSTIVTQIGVYILLAVGLNVVVGWAGLLDLGYIAFYGIGSYVTAYLVGSLPVKPPSWLHMTPLLAIPFAIGACLIAGVLLGAPTLRLRGDYLAIVTLGFGEIIQVLAINNPGNITGGPQGPNVPHPVLGLGPIHITWGLDPLLYWYLLLVFIIVMVILFYRLEGARLGRAWAAIREDEVAAQATGVNTTRAKLLAFAIGASTSGLAGVFFASQVGYFDPSEFSLQNSILIVAYVVFGGMGSLPGAIAGAALLTWLPQFLKDQVPVSDRQMWIGALVLAMMIFRPAGLIPAKRRRAELTGLDSPASSEVTAVPASEGL